MARRKYLTEDDFFNIPKYNGCGIYAIICLEDFSCYVGSSRNIKSRAKQHKLTLIAGTNANKGLQKAHDEKKILRFIILQKIDEEISKDVLLLIEYFYMLQMKYKCFDLYNETPNSSCYNNKREALTSHILGKLEGIICASNNIEKSLVKECGTKSGYLRNTKYREWRAKNEIEKSKIKHKNS